MNSFNQNIKPIESDVWLPFKSQQTVNGIKNTPNFGQLSNISYISSSGRSLIKNVQLGDGTTSSTFPSMIGVNGFRFLGSQYLTINSLTLGTDWSIGILIRPRNYSGTDISLCEFSNGGGIIINDSVSSNELTYYDGSTRISSGIELEDDRFYFICVTKDSGNNVDIYINGELSISGIGVNSGFDLDYIGCNSSISQLYSGEIRELFVFNSSLAFVQIDQLNNYMYRGLGIQKLY